MSEGGGVGEGEGREGQGADVVRTWSSTSANEPTPGMLVWCCERSSSTSFNIRKTAPAFPKNEPELR